MFNYKKHPYNLFLVTAILILICSTFPFDQSFFIHLYDTYFVFEFKQVFWRISLILLILWKLYLLTRRLLFSQALFRIHILSTLICSIIVTFLFFYQNRNITGNAGMPRRYDYEPSSILHELTVSKITAIAFLLLVLVQLVYLVNLSVGFYKHTIPRRGIAKEK